MILEENESTTGPNVVHTTPSSPVTDQQPPNSSAAMPLQSSPVAVQQPPNPCAAMPTPHTETTLFQTTVTACSQTPHNDSTTQPQMGLDDVHLPSLNGADQLPHSLDISQPSSQIDTTYASLQNNNASLPPANLTTSQSSASHDNTQHQPEVDATHVPASYDDIWITPITSDGPVPDLTQG